MITIRMFTVGLLFIFASENISALDLPELKLNNKNRKLTLSNMTDKKSNFTLSGISHDKNKLLSKIQLNDNSKKDKSLLKFDLDVNRINYTDFSGKVNLNNNTWESSKKFWVGFGEMALLEFIPFAFSAYIKDWSGSTEKNWTKISFKTVYHNISSGWFYDGDNFLTNFFAHPYHGNLFFNAGRTNGYNFWESSLFSMSGSAVWEHFMETWEPAFNDWVLTSLNGINLGEITYRLATLVTDNRSRGSTRMWSEIAGAIINPLRGFNRVISGETGKNFDNPSWRNPDVLHATFSGGVRRLDKNNGVNFATEGIQEGLFEFELQYLNKKKSSFKTPFSNFRFMIELSSGSPNLTRLLGYGHLYGFVLKDKKSHKQQLIETLNYDYVNNPGFNYGAASFVTNFINQWNFAQNSNVTLNINARVIPMGATPDDYFAGPEGRNYDFGSGVGAGAVASINSGRWSILSLMYNSQMIWTQSEPAESKHFLHYLSLELQYPMKEYFVIGVDLGAYWRNSYYNNYDDVYFETPVARLFFKTAIL